MCNYPGEYVAATHSSCGGITATGDSHEFCVQQGLSLPTLSSQPQEHRTGMVCDNLHSTITHPWQVFNSSCESPFNAISCPQAAEVPPDALQQQESVAPAVPAGATSVPIRLCLPAPGYFWRISASPSSLRAGNILALAHPFVSEQ